MTRRKLKVRVSATITVEVPDDADEADVGAHIRSQAENRLYELESEPEDWEILADIPVSLAPDPLSQIEHEELRGFVDWLRNTLIPDMRETDPASATAGTLEEAADWIARVARTTVQQHHRTDADDSPPAYRCTHCGWESDSDLDLHRMDLENQNA
jgi:hypothetical protein